MGSLYTGIASVLHPILSAMRGIFSRLLVTLSGTDPKPDRTDKQPQTHLSLRLYWGL